MDGTFLAGILITGALYALGFALLAIWRRTEGNAAEKTSAGRAADYVTREELKDAIENAAQEYEFETNKWYEKFNALHQRLSKREKRAPDKEPELELVNSRSAPPSVRSHYLKRGG